MEQPAKNPLQEQTSKELEEMQGGLTNDGSTVPPIVPRKRGRPAGSASKPKSDAGQKTAENSAPINQPILSRADYEIQAEGLLSILNLIRAEMLGVIKPIPANAAGLFKQSAPDIMLKYGGSIAAWMPELLFGASLILIGLDTFSEFKKISLAAHAQKIEKQKEETPKSEATAGKKDISAPQAEEFKPKSASTPKPAKK